uniref:Transmembrane protein n=1 Tax=Romanomermis culicivorax TaxID=13658 RepID=A0A915HGP2_ROMCU
MKDDPNLLDKNFEVSIYSQSNEEMKMDLVLASPFIIVASPFFNVAELFKDDDELFCFLANGFGNDFLPFLIDVSSLLTPPSSSKSAVIVSKLLLILLFLFCCCCCSFFILDGDDEKSLYSDEAKTDFFVESSFSSWKDE